MLRVLDLNINFYDRLEAGYQLFNWNSQDFMKYLHLEKQQVQKFENSPVCRRVVNFNFPSFSIKLNQDSPDGGKNQLLSELVLSNLDIDFKQHLDYRKLVRMRSQTFFILFKDMLSPTLSLDEIHDQSLKTLICGPIKSKRNIHTTSAFYSEPPDLQTKDFEVDIKMEADGAKMIDVQMKGLKLFIRIDILYIMQAFFLGNFPVYKPDAKDKPTYFEPDYGNYPRFATIVNLNDCLICFEQMTDLTNSSTRQILKKQPEDYGFGEESEDLPKAEVRFFSKTVAF